MTPGLYRHDKIFMMSKGSLIALLILAAVGYYLYRSNYFSEIDARFDYSPSGVSVEARGSDLHDCKLSLTNDFEIEIPFLRANRPLSVLKTDFKQWNGTGLERIRDLGETIEFHMRCREGKIDRTVSNRYYEEKGPQKSTSDGGEITDSN
jgi:hypothetical protein